MTQLAQTLLDEISMSQLFLINEWCYVTRI